MDDLYIGDFRVDIKRNEIIYQDNISTLEPKIFKVLLILAEKPGEIVSHQKLIESVWPDVIVEANTLQRCIAQLRKTFNDDAKNQRVIATHPRMGYSLVADVNRRNVGQHQEQILPRKGRYMLVVAVTLLVVASLWNFFEGDVESSFEAMNFKHITPLTSTDATEYRASFSPVDDMLPFNVTSLKIKTISG